MTTAQQRKLDEIRTDLFSNDDNLVAKAISRCEEKGSAPLVEALIALYASEAPKALRQRVGEMLGSLKVSNIEEYFVAALANADFSHIRKELIGFMWSSGLQPVHSVALISNVAASDDYFLTLECLTLLESIEDAIPEAQLLESIEIMHAKLNSMDNADHRRLIAEYLVVLNRLRALEDFNS